MDISDKLPPIQKPTPLGAVDKIVPTRKPRAKTQPGGDRVSLSGKAREMQAARNAIDKMPDVDQKKVDEIKAKIQNGTYAVDSKRTAAKMLSEALLQESR